MSELNAQQKSAVEHGDGPLLILAGAGSGKTRVVTRRIAALIRGGTRPSSIVAVSFTNKAANEMSERMVALVGSRKAAQVRTSTFHSFGLEFLKEESHAAGTGGRFVIFDQGDALGLVKEILRERYHGGGSRRFDAMAILARISNWKNAMVAAGDLPDSASEYDGVARDVYPEYDARLRAMRAVDFDDLICRPVRLLRENEDVRARWRKRIEHLLVDEFQDTSRAQLEMVKLLANDRRNICVVGDDDQSIYGWRGADVGNILEFGSHFPGARLIKLETNYRSRAPILEVANSVIAGSGKRHEKKLRAARAGGDAVRRCACESPRAEARFVVREIRQLRGENVKLEQIAVLYRSNQQSRLIEEELGEAAIPFRLFGGQRFFDRKEVKDTAAYLRFVVNPYDEISLRRVINYPARGVGTRSVQCLEDYARQHRMTFVKAFSSASQIDDLPDGARAAVRNLDALFTRTRARLKSSGSLHRAACDLVEAIDLRRALEETSDRGEPGTRRHQNVLHLLRWIERYESSAPRSRRSLQDFLQRVTLQGDSREPESTGQGVTLCTLHAAKGLEFDVVFLIGCIEGQLPHSRTTDPRANEAVAGDLDEERRLFYVGITRARDRLYLVAPRQRMLRGKIVDVTPSRYMDDLPDRHVEVYERPEQEILTPSERSAMIRELRASREARAASNRRAGSG